MRRFLSDPRVYVAWCILTVSVLFAAHGSDPYLFGLAVFALGAVTAVLCIVGIVFQVASPGASRGAKWTMLLSLSLTVAAVLSALAVLGTFRWA